MFSLLLGPATVRMVSNNGPPLPMPMQVPPGHMVQQIVDENGILTHVILSPQPPGMPPGPPMTVGYFVSLPTLFCGIDMEDILSGCLSGWLAGSLTCWLVGWLAVL